MPRLPRVAPVLAGLLVLLGGALLMNPPGRSAEPPAPNRAREGQWVTVQRALDEGKPKSALEALAGIEQSAIAAKAWDEAARAIATRVHADTGDRPPEDPERLVRLEAALQKAPRRGQAGSRSDPRQLDLGIFSEQSMALRAADKRRQQRRQRRREGGRGARRNCFLGSAARGR